MDKLDEIFDMQEKLNADIVATRGLPEYGMQEWMQKLTLATLSELSELTSRGYTPVVAHPERYYAIRHDKRLVDWILERGAVFQVNADSLGGNLDSLAQRIAVDLIKRGVAKFIASDAHDKYRRNMDFKRKFSAVPSEITQKDLENCLNINPGRVLKNEDIFD